MWRKISGPKLTFQIQVHRLVHCNSHRERFIHAHFYVLRGCDVWSCSGGFHLVSAL